MKEARVTDLEAALFGETDGDVNEHVHTALFPLSEDTLIDTPWLVKPLDFVRYFGAINICRNSAMVRHSSKPGPREPSSMWRRATIGIHRVLICSSARIMSSVVRRSI